MVLRLGLGFDLGPETALVAIFDADVFFATVLEDLVAEAFTLPALVDLLVAAVVFFILLILSKSMMFFGGFGFHSSSPLSNMLP